MGIVIAVVHPGTSLKLDSLLTLCIRRADANLVRQFYTGKRLAITRVAKYLLEKLGTSETRSVSS